MRCRSGAPEHFNPRSPYGERPPSDTRITQTKEFQSTLPLRGATDTKGYSKINVQFQSTLPLRGATSSIVICFTSLKNFNPRSPYGERPGLVCADSLHFAFQSTLPLRGATSQGLLRWSRGPISIHAPLTGSDAWHLGDQAAAGISIHAPLTGSDKLPFSLSTSLWISIHAPLTGSDLWN